MFLYACTVFLSNLVLRLFHSDDMDIFLFLLFGFLFSFSEVKSILRGSSMQTLWHHSMKNFCYQKCLNNNHHLMTNSGRRRSHQCLMVIRCLVNLLNTKRILLYINNQSVPRCKHFPSRL